MLGDLACVDDEGYCNCVRKMMDSGGDGYFQCKCTCRYLGESIDHLIYGLLMITIVASGLQGIAL